MIKILLNNYYPLEFIFQIIREKLKTFLYFDNNNKKDDNKEIKNHFLPFLIFIPLGKKISQISKAFGFRTAFSCTHTLNNFIKSHKKINWI